MIEFLQGKSLPQAPKVYIMTSFVRTDASQAGLERVQRAAESPLMAAFHFVANAGRSWTEARRRAKEEDRMIADLSRAMNGLAVDNIRRYD